MKLGVIGAGRLGLCFALLCEDAGHDVIVSDINSKYISGLTNKEIYTNEPEVEDMLMRTTKLTATTSNSEVIKRSDVIFTFVPTPSLEDGSYDCSYVDDVLEDLINFPNLEGKIFVIGCTTNPGYSDKFAEALSDRGIRVYYNPEFIAQGTIINDMRTADMVLCGGEVESYVDEEGFDTIKGIFEDIQDTPVRFHEMSRTAAEITKIGINCFLTYKISYANMMGQILYNSGCGNEIGSILSSIGDDSRIGSKYLRYGLGFGGPCLPRDNRALGHYADRVGLQYSLPKVTDDFNDTHAEFICNYCIEQNVDNLPYFIESIAFKKGSDMVVESPRYRLVTDLLERGYTVYVQDISDVIEKYADDLYDKYDDRIIFVRNEAEIYEPTWRIDL
jgi:nucleotide sugar dehydrogenase